MVPLGGEGVCEGIDGDGDEVAVDDGDGVVTAVGVGLTPVEGLDVGEDVLVAVGMADSDGDAEGSGVGEVQAVSLVRAQ
jgi:hypothetical protein